jgi:hypothetical protein
VLAFAGEGTTAAGISGHQDDGTVPIEGAVPPPESRRWAASAEWSLGCSGEVGGGVLGAGLSPAPSRRTPACSVRSHWTRPADRPETLGSVGGAIAIGVEAEKGAACRPVGGASG